MKREKEPVQRKSFIKSRGYYMHFYGLKRKVKRFIHLTARQFFSLSPHTGGRVSKRPVDPSLSPVRTDRAQMNYLFLSAGSSSFSTTILPG